MESMNRRNNMQTSTKEAQASIALKDIVFATDFSPAAENALLYAADLARRFHAELHVVNAVEPANYTLPRRPGTRRTRPVNSTQRSCVHFCKLHSRTSKTKFSSGKAPFRRCSLPRSIATARTLWCSALTDAPASENYSSDLPRKRFSEALHARFSQSARTQRRSSSGN